MKIIPAIDIINGQCVRLTQGDYDQKKVYADDPLTVAQSFEKLGVTNLHLVDLDGAKARTVVNWKVVEKLCSETSLKIDFGGGINSKEDIARLLALGVAQVNIGSKAVSDPPSVYDWMNYFGSDKIILAADIRDGYVVSNGWTSTTNYHLTDLIKSFQNSKIQFVACTDVGRDGMLGGPNDSLYQALQNEFPGLKIIASGGVRNMDDIHRLEKQGIYGVIVGKAFYEGTIAPEQVQTYLRLRENKGN